MKAIITLMLLVLAFVCSKAQIVYTDVNPDQVFRDSGSVYHLDLNKDGINDFDISYTKHVVAFSGHCNGTQTNYSIDITPQLSNAVLSDVDFYPYALNLNDAISPGSASWSNTTGPPLRSASWRCVAPAPGCHICIYHLTATLSGNWSDTADKYLGLKLIKGTNTYYGWARLSVSASGFTIKDYAYNSTPNDSIFAGQMNNAYTLISSITAPPYCAGSSINVSYLKEGNGTFNAANIFTVQLSDSSGSFSKPVAIGSKQSTAGGAINATIPSTTLTGSKYRLRIISSSPTSVSYDNGTDIVIEQGIPKAVISAGSATKFCFGGVVRLSEVPAFGYTYQWMENGVLMQYSISSDVDLQPNSSGNYNYQCIVTNACGITTSNSIALTVYPLPAANIVPSGPPIFCAGGSVSLTANSDPGLTYQWLNNGVSISGATKIVYTTNTTGEYTVQETDKNGCIGTAPVVSVAAIAKPVATIIADGDTTFCSGGSVTLFVANANFDDDTYQWQKNDVTISGATSQTYNVKTSGIYKGKVTNNCGSSISRGITVTTKKCKGSLSNATSFNEEIISNSTQFKIAPNPFSNSTAISFTLPQSQKVFISIFDMTGRLVKILTNAGMQAGIHQLTWDAKDEKGNAVSSGVYFLRMMAGNFSQTQKIILIK